MQHLIVRTDVNTSPLVPAKVAACESAVMALTGITNWDMRCDPQADQPADETSSPISGVGRKPLRLQVKSPLGAIDHRFCGLNFVIGPRWRWLNVDNYRVLDVDEIIEPIAKLHALVGFRRPRR